MLEIINDVLEAEVEAEKLLNEARQGATRVRNEFAEEESRTLRDAQAKADLRLREQIAAAREEQDARVSQAEDRVRAEANDFDVESMANIAAAVQKAVALIRGET